MLACRRARRRNRHVHVITRRRCDARCREVSEDDLGIELTRSLQKLPRSIYDERVTVEDEFVLPSGHVGVGDGRSTGLGLLDAQF